MENGGPAPESVTDKIYQNTTTINEYLIAEELPDVWCLSLFFQMFGIYTFIWTNRRISIFDFPQVDISTIAVSSFSGPEGQFDVDVFDSTSDYIKLMKYVLLIQDFPFMVLSIYSE